MDFCVQLNHLLQSVHSVHLLKCFLHCLTAVVHHYQLTVMWVQLYADIAMQGDFIMQLAISSTIIVHVVPIFILYCLV